MGLAAILQLHPPHLSQVYEILWPGPVLLTNIRTASTEKGIFVP